MSSLTSCYQGLNYATLALRPIRNLRNIGRRGFAIRTPAHTIANIKLASQRIMQIADYDKLRTALPLHASWSTTSSIVRIIPTSQSSSTLNMTKQHCYFGGLPALMQAARYLEKQPKDCTEKVLYVNDMNLPKTLQSGHQGHVHPSEWTAEECSTKNLFKAMCRSIGVLAEDNPNDLEHYSYLHFPIKIDDIVKHPLNYLRMYGKFFRQRVFHNLTAVNGVSQQDRWVCNTIAKSLQYHQKLSDLIEQQTGSKTFTQQSRVYWSPNLKAMQMKEKTWKELGIKCEFMSKREVMQRTLLKANAPLHILKIFGDGKFYPRAPELIIEYLLRNYSNFLFHKNSIEEIHIDKDTGKPFEIVEKDLSGKYSHTPIATLFGSPGHNNVLLYDMVNKAWKLLWDEVPVSGISSIWKCKIEKKEIFQRLNVNFLTDAELHKHFEDTVACANLSNLHVTSWNCFIKPTTVELLIRASQGANFNSLIANKLDLINMSNNLAQFFIGDWDLISVGTCTRKTWVSNVPEFVRLYENSGFLHGLSGLGYSFSGAPPEDLIHP